MYTSYCFEKTQAFLNMYIDIKGQVYANTYATTNIYAENIILNMSQASGGFQYESSCNFEGKLNLAEHVYKNIYTFTSTKTPIKTDVIYIAGNCNATVSNITIQVFVSMKLASSVIRFVASPAWVPQDDVLQFFHIDNVYSTMPEYPTGENAGYILIFTTSGSTRKYQYIIRDSIFDDRNNDPEIIYTIGGQFIENTIVSNITHINNQISDRISTYSAVLNLSMNDITFTSNILNGDHFLMVSAWFFVTIDNIVIDDNIFTYSSSGLIDFIGINFIVQITNLKISNWDLYSRSVLDMKAIYGRITISGINAENLTTDTDGLILNIELAIILQASLLSFKNISSYDSESSNNYMISITAMDLAASYPSVIQNITVSNSNTGIMNIQSVIGDLSDNNALVIQNMVVSECTINTKIDMITLSSLNTYELYSTVFSNLTFQNLEFTQNANIFNLGHLLPVPVQILDSSFSNIKGGKININSFTSEIANLSTIVLMENVTAKNINAKYNSFLELRTGAVLSINNSIFTHVGWYEEGSVLFAGTEQTKTKIENTIFENDTALQGGVIFVEQQSVVKWSNCTFINNFAVEGGVIAIFDNGYFIISDSLFSKNIALAGLVVSIFNSTPDSSLLQSDITNNIFLDSNSIIEEITETWNLLWFQGITTK